MKKIVFPFVAVAMLLGGSLSAFADLTPSEFVQQWNSSGIRVDVSSATPATIKYNSGYSSIVDLSGYSTNPGTRTAGRNSQYSFDSFCLESGSSTPGTNAYAVLNYDAATGKSYVKNGTSTVGTLKVGGAVLYKLFASGELTGYPYTQSSTAASTLQTAFRVLTGTQTGVNWSTNTYLNYLLTLEDQSYWTQDYNANQYYSQIGDYSVFVMNMTTSNGIAAQDFLYIAKVTGLIGGGGGVPEPATILFWAIGGGIGCYVSARKRKSFSTKV
ncbi:MAG: hypothetical protein LBQ54_08840 [Planctomycetaceae bacterium]|jgi:hypothetical protein|nr:hypothetical protein [Planctomycetaceae bacterium]